MVEKISVEIGLEGGDEVTRQLEQIGQAGQKTFSDIQGAAEQVDFSSIADGFDQVGNTGQEAFDKIRKAAEGAAVFEQIIQGVKKVEGAFEALGTAATKMAARMTRSLGVFGVFARALGPVGIAAGALGALLIKSESQVSGAINGMLVSATKLGVAVQEFDKLRQALLKTGVSADAVVPGLQHFQQVLAAEGFAPTQLTQQYQNLIARLEQMPDGVQRNTLAFERLGDSLGASVIAGLQTGTLTAANFTTALAGVTPVTQAAQIQAAQYQQAINGLSNAWTQFTTEVSAPIATPALQFLTAQMPAIQSGVANTVKEFQLLWSAIDAVATTGAQAIAALAAPIQMVADEVARLIATLSGWNWSIVDAGVAAWNALTGAIQGAIDALLKFIGLKPSAPATGGSAPGKARGGLLGGRGTGTSDSNLAWVSRGEYITPAGVVRKPGVLSFLETLRRSGHLPGFAAGGLAGGGAYTVVAQGDFEEKLLSVADKLQQIIESLRDVQFQVLQAGRRAGGGLLGGRGTGTSDSNLAWVSRGEYITPARAVSQPGVLAFLEALRRSGGNLSRVLDGMGHFALGGMVPRAIPAFATGGLARGNNVTIQFPGLPAIGGLRASSSVVDQLQKAAALAQVRSGGRKPSRYS